MADADVVEATVSGVGTLRNPVVAAPRDDDPGLARTGPVPSDRGDRGERR
jgi:hypothetical protein